MLSLTRLDVARAATLEVVRESGKALQRQIGNSLNLADLSWK